MTTSSDATELLGEVVESSLKSALKVTASLSHIGVSLPRFELWRVRFWLFFKQTHRAQRIILKHIEREE